METPVATAAPEPPADLLRQLGEALAAAAAARERIAFLEHELAQLKRLIFGAKSERFVPGNLADQLPLFEAATTSAPVEAPAPAEEPAARRPPRKKPSRQTLPARLPRKEVVIEPEGDRTGLVKIGEEVTETLLYLPGSIVVLRRVRPKYVDPTDASRGVIIAPLPPRPVDKGIAEPSLLAHVVVEKYVDHLPLYRQVQRFRREGIQLSDATLAGWTRSVGELLVPLYDALAAEIRASGYIQADETSIRVQDSEKKGKTHQGWYWVYQSPERGLVAIEYRKGRGRAGPMDWLAGYEGILQSDGYGVYDAFDKNDAITHVSCWTHARRNFSGDVPSERHEALSNRVVMQEHNLRPVAAGQKKLRATQTLGRGGG